MKNILNFLLAVLVIAGCKKMPRSVGQRDLDATELSGCPGGECKFLYSEWGDVDMLKSEVTYGRFRIFWSAYTAEGIPVEIFIKAPMEGIAFSLSNLQLASGWGIWQANCPECRLRPLRISGGSLGETGLHGIIWPVLKSGSLNLNWIFRRRTGATNGLYTSSRSFTRIL